MGWLDASQPDGASAGHPIEIASANLTCGYSAFKRAEHIRLERLMTD